MSKVRNAPERKHSLFYEGHPIDRCPTLERLHEDARIGSFRLKQRALNLQPPLPESKAA